MTESLKEVMFGAFFVIELTDYVEVYEIRDMRFSQYVL
jgi:hypothetical protein